MHFVCIIRKCSFICRKCETFDQNLRVTILASLVDFCSFHLVVATNLWIENMVTASDNVSRLMTTKAIFSDKKSKSKEVKR